MPHQKNELIFVNYFKFLLEQEPNELALTMYIYMMTVRNCAKPLEEFHVQYISLPMHASYFTYFFSGIYLNAIAKEIILYIN